MYLQAYRRQGAAVGSRTGRVRGGSASGPRGEAEAGSIKVRV